MAGGNGTRVAVISLHTSPLDQPGTGDSGGMNVYIRSVAERLAERGVEIDVFTRCRGRGVPEVEEIRPGVRVMQVKAGPCAPVGKERLPGLVPEFADGVLAFGRDDGLAYDIVHSHYWLSGWVGKRAKERWGTPLVASFHTLGKVKNYSLAPGDAPEPEMRLHHEQRVVGGADAILAPTSVEAAQLVGLYGAGPDRIHVVPPGVDPVRFTPRPPDEARARIGLVGKRVLLFVGRLQQLKGPDVAVRALAEAVTRDPEVTRDLVLAVVGGPSGSREGASEVAHLMELATAAGVGDRVQFHPPQRQDRLADFYSAADALLMPSRSESFGLVALEAQACGAPVVAAAEGGLRTAVRDGQTGFLVCGHDPGDYGERILRILRDDALASRLRAAAVAHARGFSWDLTAGGIGAVYRDLVSAQPGGLGE